jgi:hypothetical protein
MPATLNPSPPAVLDPIAPQGDSAPMTADAAFKSDFLRTLRDRGYIHQITHPDELDAAASTGVVTAYIGFDATAPSLHVGSLIQIMMLRRLQQAGHKPVVLMGGGTTKVGDPTGKDESRKLLSDADIAANIASIKTVFAKFLTFGDGPTDAVMVDNDEWLSPVRLRPVPARLRRALHGQPHAGLRLGQAAARARAADDLPRVQLHADAVGGLPGAVAVAGLPAADGRVGPVGQHPQRAWS